MATKRRKRATFPMVDGLIMERLNNPKYYTHFERFHEKPSIAADYTLTTETLHEAFNKKLIVLGTNHTGSLCTFNTKGGITLTTAGADGDNTSIGAHTTDGYTALESRWSTDACPLFMANIVTGSNIANTIIYAGWKLTNNPTTATDNDQAFFRYEDDVNSGKWQGITSVAGVDIVTDTGITVNASTRYMLIVDIDKDRKPHFYINDTEVATASSVVMTDLNTIEFFIGVEADGASAAKSITIRNFLVSQIIG